jgi:hypothetical protein
VKRLLREVADELAREQPDRYDDHPTVTERLRALGSDDSLGATLPPLSESAAALLRDVEALEHQVLAAQYGADNVDSRKPMEWSELPALFAREAERVAHERSKAFATATVADAADGMREPTRYRAAVRATFDRGGNDVVEDEHLDEYTRWVIHRLVLAAVIREGWAIETSPGAPLVCRHGDHSFDLGGELERSVTDKASAPRWRAVCDELGIGHLPLAPASSSADSPAAEAPAVA